MPTKKEIINNVLIRELIEIRTDTLWRMLSWLKRDRLPGVYEEEATGKLDNKGAIFVPGGLVNQDVDEKEISYEPISSINEPLFRQKVRDSMRFDNATLLFRDGLLNSVNLDSGFFQRRHDAFSPLKLQHSNEIGKLAAGCTLILTQMTSFAAIVQHIWIRLTGLEHVSAHVFPSA